MIIYARVRQYACKYTSRIGTGTAPAEPKKQRNTHKHNINNDNGYCFIASPWVLCECMASSFHEACPCRHPIRACMRMSRTCACLYIVCMAVASECKPQHAWILRNVRGGCASLSLIMLNTASLRAAFAWSQDPHSRTQTHTVTMHRERARARGRWTEYAVTGSRAYVSYKPRASSVRVPRLTCDIFALEARVGCVVVYIRLFYIAVVLSLVTAVILRK